LPKRLSDESGWLYATQCGWNAIEVDSISATRYATGV